MPVSDHQMLDLASAVFARRVVAKLGRVFCQLKKQPNTCFCLVLERPTRNDDALPERTGSKAKGLGMSELLRQIFQANLFSFVHFAHRARGFPPSRKRFVLQTQQITGHHPSVSL